MLFSPHSLFTELRKKPTGHSLSLRDRRSSKAFPGLELGMTFEQVGRGFTLEETENNVARLLNKYGFAGAAKDLVREESTSQIRSFAVSGKALPDGVASAGVRTIRGIVYQVTLAYEDKALPGLVASYVAKNGTPAVDTGISYYWQDEQTRLQVELSNVLFFDRALEREVNLKLKP